jgi:hypothetical protein
MFDYFNPNPYSQKKYSVCHPLINFYPIRLNISVSNPISKSASTAIFKYHDSPSPTKNPKPIKSQDELFSNHAQVIIFERNQIRLSIELIAEPSVRPNSFRSVFSVATNSAGAYLFRKIFSAARFRILGQPNPAQ